MARYNKFKKLKQTKFSFNRKITSYGKVRNFISFFIRGKKIFRNNSRIKDLLYLNVGCGVRWDGNFINLDYIWHENIDICSNIEKDKYPFVDNSLEGIYSEHCLEHISYNAMKFNLEEFFRILKPKGIVRIVMPDGELYFDLYKKKQTDDSIELPYSKDEPTAMYSINRIFRDNGHKFIYDFQTLKLLLSKAGFSNVQKKQYKQGNDSKLLIDWDYRARESFYVEAIK